MNNINRTGLFGGLYFGVAIFLLYFLFGNKIIGLIAGILGGITFGIIIIAFLTTEKNSLINRSNKEYPNESIEACLATSYYQKPWKKSGFIILTQNFLFFYENSIFTTKPLIFKIPKAEIQKHESIQTLLILPLLGECLS